MQVAFVAVTRPFMGRAGAWIASPSPNPYPQSHPYYTSLILLPTTALTLLVVATAAMVSLST